MTQSLVGKGGKECTVRVKLCDKIMVRPTTTNQIRGSNIIDISKAFLVRPKYF